MKGFPNTPPPHKSDNYLAFGEGTVDWVGGQGGVGITLSPHPRGGGGGYGRDLSPGLYGARGGSGKPFWTSSHTRLPLYKPAAKGHAPLLLVVPAL